MMLIYSYGSKKSSKNKEMSKSTQDEGGRVEKKGKDNALKETSFCCGKEGHWKRNCKAYLESKKKVACDAPLPSSIYVIKANTISPNNIWAYDTSCSSYIWIVMQGLRSNRKLKKRESDF